MPLKRQLLLASAFVLVGPIVHSQGLSPGEGPTHPPTAPFVVKAIETAQQPAAGAGALQSATPALDGSPTPRGSTASQHDASKPWSLAPPPTSSGEDSGADKIDLSPLRYFASQNDMARVAAEIRLLRSKYPNWEPPQDLFSGATNPEIEKPLWDLFAKGDFEGVRAGITDAQQKNADWQPSGDLMTKLSLAEANKSLVEASDNQQWDAVIEIAAGNKMLMTCNYVDALWRTAEALVRTDDEPRAVDAYRYVLTTCADAHERLASIQKASQLIKSPEDLDGLMKLGRRLSNGKSEFDSTRLDLIRQRIGGATADKTGAEADEKDIATLAVHAKSANDHGDQQLLGWYFYSKKDYSQSERWFTSALQAGPEPKAAEGLILTLRDSGKTADARRLALQYAPLGPLNKKLMIEITSTQLNDAAAPALSPDELAIFIQAVDETKSPEGAQNYGWRLYNAGDLAGAQTWFQKSAEWRQNESAAFGLIVTARRLNKMKDYADLVGKYKPLYPKVAEFDNAMSRYAQAPTRPLLSYARHYAPARGGSSGWDANAAAIVKQLQSGNYQEALTMLDERKNLGRSEPAGLALVRGWAQYHTGDWEAAKRSFANAEAKGEVGKAKEGLGYVERGYLPPWLR